MLPSWGTFPCQSWQQSRPGGRPGNCLSPFVYWVRHPLLEGRSLARTDDRADLWSSFYYHRNFVPQGNRIYDVTSILSRIRFRLSEACGRVGLGTILSPLFTHGIRQSWPQRRPISRTDGRVNSSIFGFAVPGTSGARDTSQICPLAVPHIHVYPRCSVSSCISLCFHLPFLCLLVDVEQRFAKQCRGYLKHCNQHSTVVDVEESFAKQYRGYLTLITTSLWSMWTVRFPVLWESRWRKSSSRTARNLNAHEP